MPNQPRDDNPPRAIRVSDELWHALKKQAAERGLSVSAAVREAITAYVGRGK